MTPTIRAILLAEDSPADAEMAIDALREANLANPIVHVEDGIEAMDYLLRRGKFANRAEGLPAVILLDIKMPRMDGLARSWDLGVNAYVVKPVDSEQFFNAVKTLGRFWAVLNETPSE